MMSRARMLAMLVVLTSLISLGESHWSYRDIPRWKKSHYPACLLTSAQSPVNIVKSTTMEDSKLTALTFTGYSKKQGTNFLLENKGYTVQLNANEGDWQLSGGNLNSAYQLLHVNFHWNQTDSAGSEHTIDSTVYPLEMHLVHKKMGIDTFKLATNVSDGLAILAVLFEIGEENAAFNPLFKGFSQVHYKRDAFNLTQFPISQLLPANVDAYYRYSGSLTMPGCQQSVTWTVFMQTVKISAAQMAKFRALQFGEQGSDKGPIAPNFRPIQPLNGRMVHRTLADIKKEDTDKKKDTDKDTNASAIAQPAIAGITLSLLSFIVVFIAKP